MPLELVGALVAGILTTLAPCVLPLLPVIVGGSLAVANSGAAPAAGAGGVGVVRRTDRATRDALVICASLGASVLAFTLLLKASTVLLDVPPELWQWLSGGLLVVLGVVMVFPEAWDRLVLRLGLQARAGAGLAAARGRGGTLGLVLTGAALGPVFTSCSPLYGYVIVTVLPASVGYGLLLLVVYVLGLSGTLLAIALLGQRAVRGVRWAADPHGAFRRGLGIVFVVVGVLVLTGWMKDIETWLVQNSPWRPWELDQGFLTDN
jgi:cytochrome c-type biogenesis protein